MGSVSNNKDEELLKLISKPLKRNLEMGDGETNSSKKERTDNTQQPPRISSSSSRPSSTRDRNTITLTLPSNGVPTEILEKLNSFLLSAKWGLPDESFYEFLRTCSYPIEVYQAFAYYTSLLHYKKDSQMVEKTIAENAKVFQELYDVYQKDISYISDRFDVPPLAAFQAILGVKGIDPKTKKFKNGRDRTQYAYALKNDVLFGQVDGKKDFDTGRGYEKRVVPKLESLGLHIIVEENLAKEQESNTGDKVITPDILISNNQTVIVNGTQIRWIELKYFFGSNFKLGSVKAQIKRYVTRWGNDMLIMGLGFSESFAKQLPKECICIEGKALGIEPIPS
eukprot:TRINITY_DN16933_c0_g1_i1.p1 TRINITY_DN16933_c0_g1~~TRINITY_DN16933_c0_g1_i1.p1  ORF type:complete len:338 (-),score=55.75 TRINITY_DN16933_c0_g1_i1:34-1047(-)